MNELTEKIADFLKILADPTRLEILNLLKNSEKTSAEIQDILNRKQSTVSQQLKTLIDADLINFEKKGSSKYYNIKYPYIFKIITFIQSFVLTLERDKARKITDLDAYDTLR
jgi:DNA-binding transcriptional ArsR family regulator